MVTGGNANAAEVNYDVTIDLSRPPRQPYDDWWSKNHVANLERPLLSVRILITDGPPVPMHDVCPNTPISRRGTLHRYPQ
jgi:hypothetical protein